MQLVYFNDLHKNLGCNRGITSKNSIIPVTFPVLPAKFYALRLPSAPLSPCVFSPSADKRPVGTDISIAQKTCVFRPVDISVAAAKCDKLIYQSVYRLLGGAGGGLTPSVKACRLCQLPRRGSQPSPSSLRDATSPERGRFCSTYRQMPKSSPFGGAGTA